MQIQDAVNTADTAENDTCDLNALCSAEDIQACYEQLRLEEEKLRAQLDKTAEQRCHVSVRLASLNKVAGDMQLLQADSQQLNSMISATSRLAINVSCKVKQLDLAKTRVSQSQQRVNDLLELQSCADGVRQALADEHYEQAAVHVHRYLAIDASAGLALAASSCSSCSPEHDRLVASVSMLQRAEAHLENIVRQRFLQAVRADDVASIERFFKIFPLLNKHELGVQMFVEYLSNKVDQSSVKLCRDTESRATSDCHMAAVMWADCVTMLLESVARQVELHQPIIETFYGAGWLLTVISALQSCCDKHMHIIVDKYSTCRCLKHKVEQVNERLRAVDISQLDAADCLDARDIDSLLSELTIISARTELYLRFVRRRVSADIEVGFMQEERSVKTIKMDSMLAQCAVSHIVQKLIADYITLESYYMTQCVRKAVKLDTVDEGSLTSSVVDDTFFILKKCLRRAVSSGNIDCTCAMINITVGQLETQFIGVVETHLKTGFPSGYLDLSQAYSVLQTSLQQGKLASVTDEAELQKTQYLTALNNCHTSGEFLQQLCDEVVVACQTQFPAAPGGQRARDKLDSSVTALADVRKKISALVVTSVRQLRTGVVRPRVRPWLDAFHATSRNIDESEFASYESDDPFVGVLISRLDQLVCSFSTVLLPHIASMFNKAVLQEVTAQLEKIVLKGSYSRYGGLQLDKEVRQLVAYLLSITCWIEREKTTRLTQIATILNIEQVSEIQEYWGSSSQVEWKLSAADVRRVMSLRVDFRSDEIRRVKL